MRCSCFRAIRSRRFDQGRRLRAPRKLQHARALLARQGVDGRLHALGRLAEVAGVLGDEVLSHAPLERLLEQAEGLRHALGRVAVGAHVAHPSRHVLHREVGQADISDVGVYLARLGAVSAHGRGLYGARSFLVDEELLHELAHAHRGADGPSLALEIEDERVACALRLPTRLALDRMERPHDLARHGVGVREDRLPSVAVSPSPQATAGVGKVLHLHFLPFGFQQPFLTDIVTAKVTAK